MGFFRDLKDNLNETASELDKNDVEKNSDDMMFNIFAANSMNDVSTEPELAKIAASLVKEAALDLEPSINNTSINNLPVDNPSNEEPEFTEQSVLFDSEENLENYSSLQQEDISIIAKELSIKGELTSQGSIELHGHVTGNVTCMGKLTISGELIGDAKVQEMFAENAHIQGNIQCAGPIKIGHKTIIVGNVSATSAVIAGAVKGDIDVHGPVIIDSTAVVLGDIKSESVQVNNGATINGCCSQCYADFKPTDIFEDFIKK